MQSKGRMSNILSAKWSTAATDLAQLAQSGRPTQPKQTPSQRRKAVYEELLNALTNGEHETVKETIANNSEIKFNEAGWENLASTALKFFDNNSVRLLHEKGLPLSPSFMTRWLQKEFSTKVFDYLCDSQHLYANEQTHYKTALCNIYQNALCGYAVSQERLRAQYRHVREKIENDFPAWATTTREKMDFNDYRWQEAMERLPFKYPTKLVASDTLFFDSLSQKEVEHILAKVGKKDKMTIGELESLNRFISDDPKRLQFWIQQEKIRHNQRTTYKQQWAQWGLEGSFDWADTQLPEILQNNLQQVSAELKRNFTMYLKYSCEHSTHTWIYEEKEQKFFFQKEYRSITEIPSMCGKALICHQDLDALLGWDLLDAVLLNPSVTHLMMTNNRFFNESPIFNSMVVESPSLLHNLISTGAPAVGALLKNSNGAQLINDLLLEDKALLILWCKNTALSSLSDLVSSLPQWKNWVDSYGNNLGHYIIASRVEDPSEITPSMLNALSKIDPQWLTAQNNQGLTASQIIQTCKVNEEARRWLEKYTIGKSVKSEIKGLQSKPKTQKRRL